MLSYSADIAANVEAEMIAVYSTKGIEFKTYTSPIAAEGVRFI